MLTGDEAALRLKDAVDEMFDTLRSLESENDALRKRVALLETMVNGTGGGRNPATVEAYFASIEDAHVRDALMESDRELVDGLRTPRIVPLDECGNICWAIIDGDRMIEEFQTRDQAIIFCKKMGWKYEV